MDRSEVSITYAPAALEGIRFATLEAFHSVPHGGLEIGGVLYGRRTETGLEILAARELDCEHRFGPAFVLSESDRSRFAELLSLPQRDRQLKGFEPIGWYRSASRSASALTSEDLDFHARLFPEGGSVVLILRPARARPVRAQVYYQTTGKSWESLEEFELFPVPRSERAGASEAEPPASPDQSRAASLTPAQPEPAPSPAERPAPDADQRSVEAPFPQPAFSQELFSERETAPPTNRPRWIWLALAWLVAAASAGYAFRDFWLPKPAAPLQVGLYDLDGQLTIGWERSAGPLREAQSGLLEILDGDHKNTIELTSELLQKGTAIYRRQSGDVFVRLQARLPNGKALEGVARFSGPAALPAGGLPGEESPELQELRVALEKQAARIQELEKLNAALQKKLSNSRR